MRVKELAEWAGTTVRTVRHYHHLGLLEVPGTVRGQRDYTMAHLARLLRIRWLVEGGVPLSQVKEILAAEPDGQSRDAIHHDLQAVRDGVVAEQQKLAHRLERLDELLDRVKNGEKLGPAPSEVSQFYDEVARRLTRLGREPRVVQVERQMITVMAAHGLVPPSTKAFLAALDEEDLDACARQIIGFDDLRRASGDEGRRQAHELAQGTVALALKHKQHVLRVLSDLPDGAVGRTVWALVRALALIGYPHPVQIEFSNQVMALLHQDQELSAVLPRWGEESRW